jgi:hypothetical protein
MSKQSDLVTVARDAGASGYVNAAGDTMTGALDATNLTRDGSQVYSRDNILGTVSQSAGVPTGAIIERGSNANGEFVKYADGTMICTRNYFANPNLTFTLANGIWTFYPFTFSFPVSFVGQPSCSVGQIILATGFGWATPRDVTTSAVNFTLFDERDRSNQNVTLRYTVVGRWF